MADYRDLTNQKTSGNAMSGRPLKRMEITYGDIDIKFAINPEDYIQKEPNRATITQTKGGAWIDAWGAGIVEITLKGITGVKGGETTIDTGYQRWKALRGLFRQVYSDVSDGEEVTELIKFYNFTDNEYFYCYPTQSGIELSRNKSKPHVYQYTINLWALRKIGEPEASTGVIGNPFKSKLAGGSQVTSTNTQAISTGGDVYVSKSLDVNSEVDTIILTNTKTKNMLDIQNDCLNYYQKLEGIVGGHRGKISPTTGYHCAYDLEVQSSGAVSNVKSFSGRELEGHSSVILNDVNFISRVSIETYAMATQMLNYSPEVLSPDYSLINGSSLKDRVVQAVGVSSAYDSTIYNYIVQYRPKFILSNSEVNRLKVILLESMYVYREIYSLYNQNTTLKTTLTVSGVKLLINNIRSMILYFDSTTLESNRYCQKDISAELRKLETILVQVSADIVGYL